MAQVRRALVANSLKQHKSKTLFANSFKHHKSKTLFANSFKHHKSRTLSSSKSQQQTMKQACSAGLGRWPTFGPKLSSHTFCFERNILTGNTVVRAVDSAADKLTSCGEPHACDMAGDMACDCAYGGSARMEHGKRLRTRAYGRGGVLWLKARVNLLRSRLRTSARGQHGTQSVRGEARFPSWSSAPRLLGGGLKESIIGWGSGRRA